MSPLIGTVFVLCCAASRRPLASPAGSRPGCLRRLPTASSVWRFPVRLRNHRLAVATRTHAAAGRIDSGALRGVVHSDVIWDSSAQLHPNKCHRSSECSLCRFFPAIVARTGMGRSADRGAGRLRAAGGQCRRWSLHTFPQTPTVFDKNSTQFQSELGASSATAHLSLTVTS